MTEIIEASNLIKLYKRGAEEVRAVNGISFSVKKGEFLSIVGPSGSGKTTLLNLIGCVDIPTSGFLKLDDVDVTRLKDNELTKIRGTTIGFVFQQFFLLPTLTALENVVLPRVFTGGKNSSETEARELLALVGLEGRADHLPSQLSGGEMQRVAIARALINDPKILLADEPTGNLDHKNAEAIMDLFGKLNRQGLTVIIVTHNTELAKRAGRTLCLVDGKSV